MRLEAKTKNVRGGLNKPPPSQVGLRDPIGSMEGPRLVCDPMGVGSCVLRCP